MRTIALEEHFLSTGYREVMKKAASRQGGDFEKSFIAQRGAKLADLGVQRLSDMDANGIDLQVLSHSALESSFLSADEIIQLTREANDQLVATIAAHPTRFAGFALLPMIDPEAAATELERAVHSLGLKGAMINGTTNGRFLDHASFLPIFEQAVALDVPIYIHPAVPPASVREIYYSGFEPDVNFSLATASWGWHSEVGVHALRLILAGVFDRFPTLQIIIGHMGEMLPFMLARVDNILGPVARHLQRTVPEYVLQNFSITTSGFFTDPPFLLALQVMGVDRLLFSVDYPYSTNQQGRAFLDGLSLSPADKEKLSHLNAERLLKLPGA